MPASCTASPCRATAAIEAHAEPNLLGGVVTLSAIGRKEAAENWDSGLYRTEPPATDAGEAHGRSLFRLGQPRIRARCWSGLGARDALRLVSRRVHSSAPILSSSNAPREGLV